MKKTYDLIVAGGGMAGVAATVAAARRGLNVLLVEQSSMLGGLGTNGLMTMLMTSRFHFYGIGSEIINHLIETGAAAPIKNNRAQDYVRIPYDNEHMKRALDSIVLESGADMILYSKITGVFQKKNHITELELCGQEGKFIVSGRIFIDATGDAMLSLYAGEPWELGNENGDTQAPTMTAYYSGIDYDRYHEFLAKYDGVKRKMIHDILPQAVKDGVVKIMDYHHPGVFRISNNNVGVVNAGHIYGADCISPEGLTKATVAGRIMAKEYFDFYKKYIPGFENAYMVNTCSTLGIRETRRIVGRYVTTFEDKSNFVKFDDAIMRFDGGAVSDVHASSASQEAYKEYFDLYRDRVKVTGDDWATLPYRSLLPQKTKNMLVAGRCVSADRKVQGHIRIMGYCYMMGQAAGTAAALCIKDNQYPESVNISKLQSELKKDGVETV